MSFSESLKHGGYGEHAVWNLFNKQANVRSVVDVREDKHYQEEDIDFLVENNERQFHSVEVKTDYKAHETGNIVYEVKTNGNVGCFEKTKAKYIAYFIPHAETVYMINTERFRKYIHSLNRQPKDMGDNASGYLIPIEDLKQNKIIFYTYEGVV